jgi:hypothetical protein
MIHREQLAYSDDDDDDDDKHPTLRNAYEHACKYRQRLLLNNMKGSLACAPETGGDFVTYQ